MKNWFQAWSLLSFNNKRPRESDHGKLSKVTEPEPLIENFSYDNGNGKEN